MTHTFNTKLEKITIQLTKHIEYCINKSLMYIFIIRYTNTLNLSVNITRVVLIIV